MDRNRYKAGTGSTLLFAALAAISVFRIYYILHGPLDLSPDEAHYWEWSRRLDLSYYSKGPMIAYLIYIGTLLFGNNVFGIRIMAVIFSALSSVFIFKLVNLMDPDNSLEQSTEKHGGRILHQRPSSFFGALVPQRSDALLSALAFQAIPIFAAFGILFTIDSPFIFFWIVSLYVFYKAITNETNRQWTYWILLGLAMGFGLLTKYTMAFFPLCGLLLLFFSGKRSLLRTPMPYAAAIISLMVFTPVIVWNAQHHWVTLRHTAGQVHVAEGLTFSIESFVEFFGSQIGIVTPLFFCLIIYAVFKLFFSDCRFQSKFLFYFSIPVIAFFLLKALQGKVEANWAMMGYVTGIIAAVQLSVNCHSRAKKRFLAGSMILALSITVISHYPSMLGLPQRLDPTARLRGWKELGAEVSRLIAEGDKNSYFLVFSDSYQMPSELAFYVRGHPETFSINLGRRMNQYDLWPDINDKAAKLRQEKGHSAVNGIFVLSGMRDMPPVVASAFDHFQRSEFRVSWAHGSLTKEYSIFICYNFKNLKIAEPESF